MSIETKIDELIQAITANTTALNNVLAAAGTTVAPTPAKSRKAEKPKEQPAAPAEPEPPTEPENVVSITPEPAVEQEPAQEPETPAESEQEPNQEPETQVESEQELTPVTADDIRNFVKRVQTHFATTGKNAKDILPTVKNVRDKFAVANLNDLTEEQTGPFLAELKNLFPL